MPFCGATGMWAGDEEGWGCRQGRGNKGRGDFAAQGREGAGASGAHIQGFL